MASHHPSVLASSCLLVAVLGASARAQPSTVDPEPPPPSVPDAHQRFGVDAIAGIGSGFLLLGALRYEHPVSSHGAVTGRVMGGEAKMIESGGPAYRVAAAHVGIRRYTGNMYLGAEAGIAVAHRPSYLGDFDDRMDAKTEYLPSGAVMVGGKGDHIDYGLSVTVMWPFIAVGVQLGLDFLSGR